MRTSERPSAPQHGDEAGDAASGGTWRFIRHYLEMVAAMMVGMALGAGSHLVVDVPDGTSFQLVEMALWMTVPMVAWMWVRGHGWRSCNEMAAAMLVPAAGALALFTTGAVADGDTVFMLEHTVMFTAMFVVMLLRRDEYRGHHHGTHAHRPGA